MGSLPKNNRILVVDDEPMIRKIIVSIFRKFGDNVVSAKNGAEALDLFGLEPFDIVITDFQMPGMDGCELAASLKQLAGNTPVIMVTGSNNSKITKAMDDKKVDTLLLKPFLPEDLRGAVDGLLDKKMSITAEIM